MTTKVATRNPMDFDLWGDRAARRLREEREARRPTPTQERAERTRLLSLGKPELMKRVMRFDGRTWNELLIYSAEYFVDRLIGKWEQDGWVSSPSGTPMFRPTFAAIRSALAQLPHGPDSLAVEAENELDDIERYLA